MPGQEEHLDLNRTILVLLAAAVLAAGAAACGSAAPQQGVPPSAASGPVPVASPSPAAARSSPAEASVPAHRAGSLRVLTEPRAGIGPIYQLIAGARSSVDLTMYELADPTAEAGLAADAARGVDVRVILDQHLEKSRNLDAYDYLAASGVHVR